MEALRNSIANDKPSSDVSKKKPVASVKADKKKGIGLVESSPKNATKRKSA